MVVIRQCIMDVNLYTTAPEYQHPEACHSEVGLECDEEINTMLLGWGSSCQIKNTAALHM